MINCDICIRDFSNGKLSVIAYCMTESFYKSNRKKAVTQIYMLSDKKTRSAIKGLKLEN
jgi:hypothetical protein